MRIFRDVTITTRVPHPCMLCDETITTEQRNNARYQVVLRTEGEAPDRYWMHSKCWEEAMGVKV